MAGSGVCSDEENVARFNRESEKRQRVFETDVQQEWAQRYQCPSRERQVPPLSQVAIRASKA